MDGASLLHIRAKKLKKKRQFLQTCFSHTTHLISIVWRTLLSREKEVNADVILRFSGCMVIFFVRHLTACSMKPQQPKSFGDLCHYWFYLYILLECDPGQDLLR